MVPSRARVSRKVTITPLAATMASLINPAASASRLVSSHAAELLVGCRKMGGRGVKEGSATTPVHAHSPSAAAGCVHAVAPSRGWWASSVGCAKPSPLRQRPRVHRADRAGLDRRCRREDRDHRARQPVRNGPVKSFNARFRDQVPDGEVFTSLREAQVTVEGWRNHTDTVRPHGSIGYRPPAPEAYLPGLGAGPVPQSRPVPPALLIAAPRPTMTLHSGQMTRWKPITWLSAGTIVFNTINARTPPNGHG